MIDPNVLILFGLVSPLYIAMWRMNYKLGKIEGSLNGCNNRKIRVRYSEKHDRSV